MSIDPKSIGVTGMPVVVPVMPAFEWSGPLFAIRKEGWEIPLPPGMILPPAPAHRGVAQLFAEAGYSGGMLAGRRKGAAPGLFAGGAASGDATAPRFPTPHDAARYVRSGWNLYWKQQDDGVRVGIIKEIREIAESDIDRLVVSWDRREPYGYEAVFLFALAGHRYARQRFVEAILRKIPPVVDNVANVILDNVILHLRSLCNATSGGIRSDFYFIRGAILVLCDLASRGDKGAVKAAGKYFDTLAGADSQLQKLAGKDGRAAKAIAHLDSLRNEARYLLSQVNPDKFLDEPALNRGELDFLARYGNMRVLETYAKYAAKGCLNSTLAVINAAFDLCRRDVFGLLMEAAREEPSILAAVISHPKSRINKHLADIMYGAGGEGAPQSQMEFLVYVARKLEEFDFGHFAHPAIQSPLMEDITMAMALLGNRSAMPMAVRLTAEWLEEGARFAKKEGGLLTTSLKFIVRAREEGDPNADELIKNLAKLGHSGAVKLAIGRPKDKKAN